MGILVNKETRVLVQGITGREGSFHTERMAEYGTTIVAGVTPGKGGSRCHDIPVFNTVEEAQRHHKADASVIFVPPAYAGDAILEALDGGIRRIACITEGIPVREMVKICHVVQQEKAVLIGPNCPGLITVGETKLGIMPGNIFKKGNVGVISRSGTLTYLVVNELSMAGVGQSTCVGIGGDPLIGTSFKAMLEHFARDSATRAVVLVGEIGGSQEEEAAAFIKEHKIPTVAYIAGKTAPPGKRMGHAGAIISGSRGTAAAKVKAFQEAGVPVADTIIELVEHVKRILEALPREEHQVLHG
ncbi:MAG: succinate--CoA ligase subunit alpha [Candidatus Eremiobacteraeota bacterium]|nr:succinate--CoA ligase subunit alpha [Candidatus Eremiobacteraeota bacterium]